MSPTTPTYALAEFASQLVFEDLPPAVIDHVKTCILDSLACGLFGSGLPWSQLLATTLTEIEGGGDSQVMGTDAKVTPPTAALINGAAIHGFELDDLHQRSIVHPGSVAIPAAISVSDHLGGASGGSAIAAIVAGYEVAARVGMALGTSHLLKGWHPTGTHGSIGAAAAAGSILRLSVDEMAHALGMAASQSSGLMSAQYSSMVKRFHAGRASQSGVYSAILADRGYTGIPNVFEAPYGGYGPTYSSTFDPRPLSQGLGETWETLNVGFKPYSTNGSCHPAIDALLDLCARHGITIADVAEVDLHVSSATKEHVGWEYAPESVTTAQMNLPYIVAVVLADGDAFVNQFSPERITDPELVDFTKRVRVEASQRIDEMGDAARHHTEMEVTLFDGRVFKDVREYARGSAHAPMSRSEVVKKAAKLMAELDPSRVSRLTETVLALESCSDLRDLNSLLGAEPAKA